MLIVVAVTGIVTGTDRHPGLSAQSYPQLRLLAIATALQVPKECRQDEAV
jgi:hypothetical protein